MVAKRAMKTRITHTRLTAARPELAGTRIYFGPSLSFLPLVTTCLNASMRPAYGLWDMAAVVLECSMRRLEEWDDN